MEKENQNLNKVEETEDREITSQNMKNEYFN